jgi:protein TonB
MASTPLRINPSSNDGPSDPSLRKLVSLCDMHGVGCGSPSDLAPFMQALIANKHLAMDFWSLVAVLTDQAGVSIPLQAINGHILELTVRAITGRTVAEMIAAGSEQRRLIVDLGGLLAGEDIARTAVPPPAPEPQNAPDLPAADVEKLRADLEGLRIAFESRFGAARFGAPMARPAPALHPPSIAAAESALQQTRIPSPAPRPITAPPTPLRSQERPAQPPVREPESVLPDLVQHESEPDDEPPFAAAISLSQSPIPLAEPLAIENSPPQPAPAPQNAPGNPAPPAHLQSFAAALASMSGRTAASRPPESIPLESRPSDLLTLQLQQAPPPVFEKGTGSVTNMVYHADGTLTTAAPIAVTATSIRPATVTTEPVSPPVPSEPRLRRSVVIPVLATLLAIAACAAAYLAGRTGKLNAPRPAVATVSTSAASSAPQPSPTVPAAQITAEPAITTDPQPSTALATTTATTVPIPSQPQSYTPQQQAPTYQPTVAAKPEPAVDKGLNTKSVITNKPKDAAPTIATGLVGMSLVPATGIAANPAAAPSVKMGPDSLTTHSVPLKVTSGVMQGAKITGPNPEYPAWARAAHFTGDVVLSATITKTGDVKNLSVISGPEALRESSLNAVNQWKYRPYTLNGEPIDVQTLITIKFNARSDGSF